MRILMLVQSPVAGDTRVQREAATLVEAGHTVHIVGRDVPAGFDAGKDVTVASVTRARGLGDGSGAAIQNGGPARVVGRARRLGRWLLLPEHRQQVERHWSATARTAGLRAGPFEVIHAHDFNTLAVAADLAAQWGVPYVYDSHEFWSGRPRVGRPTPLRTRRERAVERRLGKRAAAVVTVGDGVARALRQKLGFDHVSVVRNTFPPLDEALPVPDEPTGLVYAGRLAAHRELEVVAEASRRIDLPVTLVGPADKSWVQRFDPGKAEVLPSASLDDVDDMLARAGLALVTHSDRWLNHRLAMPNKLFHAVRAGVPVVATDVGELGRLVRAHGVGALYRPGDVDHMVAAVQAVRADYRDFLARVEAAREELSWAVDADVLLGVYAGLAAQGGQTVSNERGAE